MSVLNKIWCDGCGKEVRDGRNKGWIRINATEDYSVDLIQGEDDYYPLANDQLDFCSVKCLRSWITKAILHASERS